MIPSRQIACAFSLRTKTLKVFNAESCFSRDRQRLHSRRAVLRREGAQNIKRRIMNHARCVLTPVARRLFARFSESYSAKAIVNADAQTRSAAPKKRIGGAVGSRWRPRKTRRKVAGGFNERKGNRKEARLCPAPGGSTWKFMTMSARLEGVAGGDNS